MFEIHVAKPEIVENYNLTIGEQYSTIQNIYNPLLREFCHMSKSLNSNASRSRMFGVSIQLKPCITWRNSLSGRLKFLITFFCSPIVSLLFSNIADFAMSLLLMS